MSWNIEKYTDMIIVLLTMKALVDACLARGNAALIESAKGMIYTSPINVKSPCLVRPREWFTQHRAALLEVALVEFLARFNIKPGHALQKVYDLPDEAVAILYERMITHYCDLAANGGLVMTVYRGCCPDGKTCLMIWYQRALLVAIRRKVKEEEESWPHEL